ncbi:MAG: UDP-N-acetylmuramate--L-alanine ligase [Alphaproteobacteria bacterium]|nr:MAG: UDP-N-acetylmuramate--L-alanine ligase [Alphaproteobacteria bacterium]
MRASPFQLGKIHFVGIGGIGMSGIAEVMHNLGYDVQGSDASESANVARLRDHGIHVEIGQREENVKEARVVVVSSAIKGDNPELVAARERKLPVVRRAEMLAELMRLKWCVSVGGTHGKTTTTSLVSTLLEAGGFDPTVINGGIINAYGTNTRLGEGDWMVVEADESDGTFVKLPSTVAIVTNMDPEHLDHYGSVERMKEAFQTFVENIPFYGFAVLCIDHPEVQAMFGRIRDRRLISYGMSPQADVRAMDIKFANGGTTFNVAFSRGDGGEPEVMTGFHLPMPGHHNVLNTLAAIAVAHEMGMELGAIKKALAGFGGVKRRFTHTGSWNGVTVIDDYGHHPVEISSVLHAARGSVAGKVIAVVQPHRYSRLHDLFDDFCTCFNDADVVIVADVYAAGEQPIEGASQLALIDGLRAHGHKHVMPLEAPADLAGIVAEIAEPGDMVVCLGAGNITQWANALPGQLEQLGKESTS